MFGELNFWQMLLKGGISVFILLAISVFSWWIIIDRAIKFHKLRINTADFMDKIKKLMAKKNHEDALTICRTTPGPVAAVIEEGIMNAEAGRVKMEAAMQRTLNNEIARMEKYLGLLGTTGAITPFIGLFGTVLGIIRAFHDLAVSSGGGPSVVANGIAEALVATATGLFVAIPAFIFYNIYVRTVSNIETEAINAASELADLVNKD